MASLMFIDEMPSFDLDNAMVEAYPEYCMLKKLQKLTTSVFCIGCRQQLDFMSFFSEAHLCISAEPQLSGERQTLVEMNRDTTSQP